MKWSDKEDEKHRRKRGKAMKSRRYDTAFYEKEADENKYLFFDKVVCKEESVPPHFHDSIEFVLVIKGQCDIYINGNKNQVKEGDGVFIDSFDVHYYEYYQGSEYYVFLISRSCLYSENILNQKRLPMFLKKSEKYEEIKGLFDNAYSLWKESNEVFRIGFVNMILGVMSSYYELTKLEKKGEVEIFVNTLLYINQHFTEKISLEFLSSQSGYSKSYFSTLFHKFVGMNLREYINRRRIAEFERIKRCDTHQPTYMIASECGFDSLKTFYRAYHKYGKADNKR